MTGAREGIIINVASLSTRAFAPSAVMYGHDSHLQDISALRRFTQKS